MDSMTLPYVAGAGERAPRPNGVLRWWRRVGAIAAGILAVAGVAGWVWSNANKDLGARVDALAARDSTIERKLDDLTFIAQLSAQAVIEPIGSPDRDDAVRRLRAMRKVVAR